MKKVTDVKTFLKKDNNLLKNYVEALNDKDFKSLICRLKINEEIAMRYTSKLENTVHELKNCKKCKGYLECKNKVEGYVNYPKVEGNNLRFNYVSCKYKNEFDLLSKNKASFISIPDGIKNASMSSLDLTDKNRTHLMKWVNKFYKTYEKGKKGLYLHGSFGSGKTYVLASLLNELAKNKVKSLIVYYPELLRSLKSSFNDDFENRMYELKNTEILLIDDLGAEALSPWSRDEILGTILQYRMDANLTTFITSNLNIDELLSHLSTSKDGVDLVKASRIIERIKYLTEDMELISQNRRK